MVIRLPLWSRTKQSPPPLLQRSTSHKVEGIRGASNTAAEKNRKIAEAAETNSLCRDGRRLGKRPARLLALVQLSATGFCVVRVGNRLGKYVDQAIVLLRRRHLGAAVAHVAPVGNDGLHFGLLLLLTRPSLTLNLAARRRCRGPKSHVQARTRNGRVAEVVVAGAACSWGRHRRHRRRLGRETGIAHSGTVLGGILVHAVARLWLSRLAGYGSDDGRLWLCCGGDKVQAAHRCRRRTRISGGSFDAAEYSGSIGCL